MEALEKDIAKTRAFRWADSGKARKGNGGKVSKYGNIKVTADGYTFDSKAEYRRYVKLKDLEKAKEIQALKVHPRFPLIKKSQWGREIVYVADFGYYEVKSKKVVIEDVKGHLTAVYKLKKRLLLQTLSSEYEFREIKV